jgi:heat shock protein HslJ
MPNAFSRDRLMVGYIRILPIAFLLLVACSATTPNTATQSATTPGTTTTGTTSSSAPPPTDYTVLKGTWRLIELQSSGDGVGVVRPDHPAKYELTLADDGSAALLLDCNGATGRWTSSATGEMQGTITFTPLAMSRAVCPPGSFDTRIAHELAHARTYVLKDGRLILIVTADSGSQIWSRIAE